ncbi:hypothetical protein P280DRAFT_466705 [Massarina eburnea CBS 473.64]|uniref:Extracellular membrane protein CFEM domain-containing protein n=1 Tax=Massarina eburnea CBS 473.64 TaxID=1395130 RepID=A0A6A6SC59_9PLEO|nr:hypothetical protein P280DRAFT_466705 [Massarina eburnea CBS 473.64]
MRYSTLFSTLLAAAGTVSANECTIKCKEGIACGFYVTASGVDDIPGICGGLWDNLKQFNACIGVGVPDCGGEDGELTWQFSNGSSCNGGDIEATWWDATKNKFGAIQCHWT